MAARRKKSAAFGRVMEPGVDMYRRPTAEALYRRHLVFLLIVSRYY